MNGLMCCMSQWLTISIIIQKLNKLKKIYSFNKWLTQFNHYFFFIKRDSDNKFVNIWAMSTTGIWLWFFFLFNTEPDSVKLTAEGDLTYFYKQEEVNNSSINLTFLNVFISVVFFSSEHEYIIVLEFFRESFYKQWKYLHKQMNLLRSMLLLFVIII